MSIRPPVKRQYGRKTSLASSLSSQPSSSSPTSRGSASSPRPHVRACIPSSEWSDVLEDGDSSYAAFSPVASGSTKRDSPPTSPEVEGEAKSGLVCSEAVETEDVEEVAAEAPLSSSGPTRKLQARTVSASTSNNNKQGAKADLLSFFRAVSPKKRARVHSDDEADLSRPRKDPLRRLGRKDASTPSTARDRLSSTSTSSSSSHPAKGKPVKPPKLEQLFLDPFETGGHATLSCAVCSLAYARTPEDLALHAKHHKNVVGGCDWVTGDAKGVLVIEEGIEWGAHDGGRIVMVDASAEGVLGRKIKDVLATIDTELSSTSLTPAQLGACKLFLFVSPQRKVIACAVVERIEESYRVVSSKAPPSSPTNDEKKPTGELIRFGEQDGAVFCSPTPLPTLLGVHRIWSSASHRRAGLAARLLSAAAARFIYGSRIPPHRRALDVAFSQPTGAGMALARSWTGTDGFRVFVD